MRKGGEKMKFNLYIFLSNSQSYDITDLVSQLKWKGRKGSSARSLSVKMIDDDSSNHARSGVDVEKGHKCALYSEGKELFQGIIMNTTQTEKKTLSFTAYDMGIYLANNKDTYVYENKTADDIFRDVCKRLGLPVGTVDKCTHRIPELTKSHTTAFDVIADALSLDYDNTNTRHYIMSDKGKLSLITRKKNILQYVLSTEENILSYSFNRSFEKTKTRIVLLSDENQVLATAKNTSLESRIGIFQDVDKPDETLNQAQIQQLAQAKLKEQGQIEKTITAEVLGSPDIISGVGVFVQIPHLGINGTYYVDEDTHTWEGDSYKLSVKLNYTFDT
jgi:phage protein D